LENEHCRLKKQVQDTDLQKVWLNSNSTNVRALDILCGSSNAFASFGSTEKTANRIQCNPGQANHLVSFPEDLVESQIQSTLVPQFPTGKRFTISFPSDREVCAPGNGSSHVEATFHN